MNDVFRKSSAWLPIALSMAALCWTVGYVLVVGIPKVKTLHDEGIGAHVFQFLMGLQLPVILFFLLKWFPQKPKPALIVLILQMLAIFIAFAPVYILEL